MNIEQLKFPIGKYVPNEAVDQRQLDLWINDIEVLPNLLRNALDKLDPGQLESPYRPDGWTRRQVVNHIADSHMNAFIRVKLALTEESPVIKPYFEALWAETPEIELVEISQTLTLIESLHVRWAQLFRSLPITMFKRQYFHPEHEMFFDLGYVAGMYAWHGKHHVAQIENPAF